LQHKLKAEKMPQITTLDQHIINRIAAGEVIERPASVLKELLENSIDAGADKIVVNIEEGGKRVISVSDNGRGMDADDLEIAFNPHTTSKINNDSDLQSIVTLGFRGEALASIASVAQVTAVSRCSDSPAASRIEIDSGSKGEVSPCHGDYGTSIEVRDLFYKVPARRKFLKTANTEMGHITECFTRLALANPKVDFTLNHNRRQRFGLLKDQQIQQRIAALFSSELAENLISTKREEKQLQLWALMARPEIARTSSKFQYVFLNNRYIRDKFISHAMKEAYRGTIEPNRYPVIFLFLRMPTDAFDVNVHPKKTEVRFYNSNLVHSQVLSCLREKLLATDLGPTRSSSAYADVGRASSGDRKVAEAMAEFFKRHRGPRNQQRLDFGGAKKGGHHFSAGPQPGRYEAVTPWPQQQKTFMQVHNSYIVAQTDEGLIIIDQHALHERIMYEQLKSRVSAGSLESQRLLIPQTFSLTDSQRAIISDHKELLGKLGIDLESFGPKSMAVQAFPSLLSKADPVDFMTDLLDLLAERSGGAQANELLDEVLNMAACKAAIKAGQHLTDREIEQLLRDRENTHGSSRCPHGRPTTIKFSTRELEKQFKRT